MKYFYFILVFLINRISFKIHKDIMNPVFICTTIWLLLPLLYEILCSTGNNYYRLSEKFYLLVLSFILPFVIINILCVKSYRRKKQNIIVEQNFLPHVKNLLHFCIFFNFMLILITLLAIFELIYFMTMSRDSSFMETFSFMDYIFVYLLSSLPAFDMLINGDVNFGLFTGGSQTFSFLYRIASKFGLYAFPETDKMFINIPAKHGYVPTNVYTGLAKSYMDFGNYGCIIYGILLGLFFASLYRMSISSHKCQYILFYLLTIYCLVFIFFGDLFFGFFSMILQDFLCAIIVSKKIKLYGRN